ncbi:MAG: serine/threonine protein kinase [Verrucomicrobia bacterium]|nr:serine/threonine protein kinase [Verrucomicrobiota bacterium]
MNTDDPDCEARQERVLHTSSFVGFSPTKLCATCHRPLTRTGRHGECLRCLLGFALERNEEEPSAHGDVSDVSRPAVAALRYGHFEILVGPDGFPFELGAGAMAVTYCARDTVLDSLVALKVINRQLAEHPSVRARFLREARAAAKIHHPNVASVSHYGEQDGKCYYVMELVEGETVEARVRRDGPLPVNLVLDIGVQVARALAAAEARGVVHRDLKPSNLMLTIGQGETGDSDSFIVKVIDWGLAKAVHAESELGADHTRGAFVGTPAFASPEQYAGDAQTTIDARSDIYSLGVTLWYLLCGRTPFVGRTLEEVRARHTDDLPLEQLRHADVPTPVLALLKSMLAVDPADRPQSARELLAAVQRCYARLELRARSRRKHLLVTCPVAALVIAFAMISGWFYQQARSRA